MIWEWRIYKHNQFACQSSHHFTERVCTLAPFYRQTRQGWGSGVVHCALLFIRGSWYRQQVKNQMKNGRKVKCYDKFLSEDMRSRWIIGRRSKHRHGIITVWATYLLSTVRSLLQHRNVSSTAFTSVVHLWSGATLVLAESGFKMPLSNDTLKWTWVWMALFKLSAFNFTVFIHSESK